ncbi:MAG: CPBP family intramembrane metalloprotease [Desulfobacteraceae bacterium]|nr:CPBP family intramembrane metalloprotease [Desulfobacteraceae bacterium]
MFTNMIYEIVKTDVPFVSAVILMVLVINYFTKNNNKLQFTDLKRYLNLVILCSLLYLFSGVIYAFVASTLFEIIAQNKPLPSIFSYMAVLSNIEVITINGFAVIPILILSVNSTFRQFIGLRKIQSSVLFCFILSLSALLALVIFSFFIYRLSSFNSFIAFYSLSLKFNHLNNIYLLITACFIVAISKELFFRGLIYSVLRVRVGIFLSVIITSLLAALSISWKPDLMILIFFQSCVLALVYEMVKSLYPSIVIHFFLIIAPFLLFAQ